MTSITFDQSAILPLLDPAQPLSDIRDLLRSWAAAGATRDAVRSALEEVRSELRAAGREAEEDRLLEALDLVEGWVGDHLKVVFPENPAPDIAGDERFVGHRALVLIPASAEFRQIASELVIPALEDAGFSPVEIATRFDEPNAVFALIDEIRRAWVVIVETSDLDPLVFYAIGLAHAIGRPTVLLTQDVSELPFDLRSYNVVKYSTRLDEVGRLKGDLGSTVGEFAESHRAFATPVTDRTGGSISASTRADVDVDEAVPGLYDLLPSSIAAIEAIGEDTVSFTTLTEQLGEAVILETGRIESAKAQGGPGVFAKTQLSVRAVTAQVDEYADRVAEILPRYKSGWSTFISDTMAWIELVEVVDDEDRRTGEPFATMLADLRSSIVVAADHVGEFRKAVIGLRERRLSKDLNRSLSRVEKQLKEWIDEVLLGASHLERMRALLADKLANGGLSERSQ